MADKRYTISVIKTLSGTVDVIAESEEQALEIANSTDWNDSNVQINENDHPMGLDNWEVCEILEIDEEEV